MRIIIILIIILVLFYITTKYKENFSIYWSGGFIPDILPQRLPNGTYTNIPFGSMRVHAGQTTNMRYDTKSIF